MPKQPRVLLAMALVAAVFTQLPGAVAQQTRPDGAAPAGGDAVIVWSANAGAAATKACIAPLDDPFHESRIYAMMHVAIHDALNAIDRRSRPYTFDRQAERGASPDAAVAAAARDVLVPLLGQLPRELVSQSCIDAGVASVEAAYTAALGALPDTPARAQGIAVGQAAAAAILAHRATDGAVGPFLNSNCPLAQIGKYQCTPGFPVVAFEVWEKVTPFVLQDSAQFRPGPPYAVTDKTYTADFNEVKSLGGDDKTTPSNRTADQTEIALSWYESSPLKWSRIAGAEPVRFVEGVDRQQSTLFPECLEDWVGEDNPVRVIDVFVGGLDLAALEFGGVDPEATGRPSYHPSVLLKLYVYGYLNRVQSSRRLEREAGCNVEVMWLTGRLVPDRKTIADFRKDNGPAIRKVCAQFVMLCRRIGLLTTPSVAIDGSKFKAVNNRDKNFTRA